MNLSPRREAQAAASRAVDNLARAHAEGYPRCAAVDDEGVRCIYGAHHTVSHSFAKPKAPAPEPWEIIARQRKAAALVDVIERLCPMTAELAAELDESGRRAAAGLARVRPPSEQTWALVVSTLAAHEASGATS